MPSRLRRPFSAWIIEAMSPALPPSRGKICPTDSSSRLTSSSAFCRSWSVTSSPPRVQQDTPPARRTRRRAKKVWHEFANWVQCAASAVRRAQATSDAAAQVAFGGRTDVHAAVDEAVDQRANDLGAIEQLAALAAVSGREPIKLRHLTVEEHDGDFRPGLELHGRSAGARFRSARSRGA